MTPLWRHQATMSWHSFVGVGHRYQIRFCIFCSCTLDKRIPRFCLIWISDNFILYVCWHTCSLEEYAIVGLTHWGRATHICVGKLTIIGSDNGLSPGRRQAIIGTNAGIFLIGSMGINFSEIFIEIHTFSFRKMHLNMSSAKWRSFCLGLNVLTDCDLLSHSYSENWVSFKLLRGKLSLTFRLRNIIGTDADLSRIKNS